MTSAAQITPAPMFRHVYILFTHLVLHVPSVFHDASSLSPFCVYSANSFSSTHVFLLLTALAHFWTMLKTNSSSHFAMTTALHVTWFGIEA